MRLETIDLSKIVKFVHADPRSNLDMIIEEGHRKEFDETKTLPLWHVIAISQGTELEADQKTASFAIAFFFHHGIGDGTSGAAFHLDFLDALNNLSAKDIKPPSKQTVISIPNIPLLPTLEMKIQLPLSIWFTIKQLFTTFVYSPEDLLHWWGPTITAIAPEQPPTVKLHSFALPHEMVKTLVAKCHSENSTITSLFSVLVARKLALMYPTHSRFTGSIPFDLRRFTGHTIRDMGCFLSSVSPLFSSESRPPNGYISCATDPSVSLNHDTQLWMNVRACKTFVTTKAASTTDQPVGLLKFIKDDYGSYFLSLLGKNREVAFEVTNIMVVDGGVGDDSGERNGNTGKATFDRVMFSATTPKHGYPFCVLLATAKNGDLTSTLCWEEGVAEKEEALELSKWLEGSLREIIGG